MTATLVLRPADPNLGEALLSGRYDAAAREGIHAGENAVAMVESFLRAHGLTVMESDRVARRIVISGPEQQLRNTFGDFTHPRIPPEITADVIAVLGLDPRPVAKPHSTDAEGAS